MSDKRQQLEEKRDRLYRELQELERQRARVNREYWQTEEELDGQSRTMSEIKAWRWRLNGQTSKPHLFQGDSKTSLCGAPKRATDSADRHWEDVSEPRPGDVCWVCVDERNKRAAR